MIERYALPEMAEWFRDEARLQTWLDVELAACEACEEAGLVPAGTAEEIRTKARIDAARALEIEDEVHHDVIAFLTMISESAGELARHLHHGMTSSDLVDSALSVTIRRAGDLLLTRVADLRRALIEQAERHRETVCIGRTHGVHAEPISFGLKALSWATSIARSEGRLREAVRGASVGKLSGSVGNFAHLDPTIEERFCEKLGITAEPVATQVVARDRHAALLSAMAGLAASIERIALNIRLAQRTECGELFEPFASGQKGSSSMPHKRNPVLCERLCGMSRVVRGYAQSALENVALWEERDISHSSVERVIVPDAFQLLHYMTVTMLRVVEGLVVDRERMRANIDATRGLVFSQRVLLALVESGMNRDEAYRLVQEHALATVQGGADFGERVKRDSQIGKRLGLKLAECFALEDYFHHQNAIFERGLAYAERVAAGGEAAVPTSRTPRPGAPLETA